MLRSIYDFGWSLRASNVDICTRLGPGTGQVCPIFDSPTCHRSSAPLTQADLLTILFSRVRLCRRAIRVFIVSFVPRGAGAAGGATPNVFYYGCSEAFGVAASWVRLHRRYGVFSTSTRKRESACSGGAARVTRSSPVLATRVVSVAGGSTERQQSAQPHILEERSVPESAAENRGKCQLWRVATGDG